MPKHAEEDRKETKGKIGSKVNPSNREIRMEKGDIITLSFGASLRFAGTVLLTLANQVKFGVNIKTARVNTTERLPTFDSKDPKASDNRTSPIQPDVSATPPETWHIYSLLMDRTADSSVDVLSILLRFFEVRGIAVFGALFGAIRLRMATRLHGNQT
ncbi:hypothetical protein CAPTEDRAFT_192217 [Capitella teleta]|uniref:Uncharacterized protein n=1 Tax=Capitella teleta TaxID=283909 RepID=R7TQ61_CAPTE|nr:hypothetical protein CAPTEDRAFT_192217 [Capitella teleta]|eukprot:ELT95784.1 hypothetical protein CAPTEDRAFT_192217 [Capitella teleta]